MEFADQIGEDHPVQLALDAAGTVLVLSAEKMCPRTVAPAPLAKCEGILIGLEGESVTVSRYPATYREPFGPDSDVCVGILPAPKTAFGDSLRIDDLSALRKRLLGVRRDSGDCGTVAAALTADAAWGVVAPVLQLVAATYENAPVRIAMPSRRIRR